MIVAASPSTYEFTKPTAPISNIPLKFEIHSNGSLKSTNASSGSSAMFATSSAAPLTSAMPIQTSLGLSTLLYRC